MWVMMRWPRVRDRVLDEATSAVRELGVFSGRRKPALALVPFVKQVLREDVWVEKLFHPSGLQWNQPGLATSPEGPSYRLTMSLAGRVTPLGP